MNKDIPNIQKYRTHDWFKFDGDNTLRLDYSLDENSIVFDVGGYLGLSSQKIWDKFKCNIYIFEPVKEFADKIKERFEGNNKVKVFTFGLSDKSSTQKFYVHDDGSSEFKEDSKQTEITLKKISDFIKENKIEKIDLMEINIEAGEYGLLKDLINSGEINKVTNVQVQFHDFMENAEEKMDTLRKELSKTHFPTFHYDFVWENWTKKVDQVGVLFNQINTDFVSFNNLQKEYVESLYNLELSQSKLTQLENQNEDLINRNNVSNNEIKRYSTSRSFKLGYALLRPFVFIKKLTK